MSFWDNFISGGADQAAQGYQNGINAVNQSYNNATGFMNPYNQMGMNEMGQYQSGVNAMSNPNFYNNLMAGYSQSPQAQLQLQQGNNGINAAAAASGTLGSTPEMQQMSQFNQQVSNGDMQQYANNKLGVYNQFLNGAGNMVGMGQNAAGQMGGWAMDQGSDLAQLYGQQGLANMYGSQYLNGLIGQVGGAVAGSPWGKANL